MIPPLNMSFLKRLAPSMKRSLLFSGATTVASVLIIAVGIFPTKKAIRTTGDNLQLLNTRLTQMRADIVNADEQRKRAETANAECAAFAASGVIEPLLGSFAMRGKTLLDPIAQETGFTIETVRELTPMQLQQPHPPPEQLHYRQPIEFTGRGSYAQIADFIAKTEATHRLATLSGLNILASSVSPETHRAILTFEWPAKGDKINKGVPPKGK